VSRTLGPRPSIAGASGAGGWIVLAGCWLAGGLLGLVPLPPVIAAIAAATVAAIIWFNRRTSPDDPVAALSANLPTRLTAPQVVTRAVQLRPSLRTTKPKARDIGLLLGDQQRSRRRNPTVFASWEDTVLAFMAPRSGKTTSQAIPFVLSAPGPVIATSNKADLWAATAELRAATGDRTWLFDPNHITYQEQQWWWDPLRDLTTVEEAHRLAGHFVLTVDDGTRRDLWGPAAQDLLCALFLAAASSGRSLRQVSDWLDAPSQPHPCDLLNVAGFPLIASATSQLRTQQPAPIRQRTSRRSRRSDA
jgi:Type IV secretory system Conjugative DNA transfer